MKNERAAWGWLISSLAILLAVNGYAAPGASVSFTNKIATFQDLQGHSYLEATIVRADFNADGTGQIIYRVNGDYNAVSFSKLSPDTLSYLGVPSDYAEIARNQDAKKQAAAAKEAQAAAAEQQRLLDPANLTSIRVDAVLSKVGYDSVYGTLYSCRTQFGQNPTLLNILVARLPERISAYFDSVARQQQAIAELQNQIAGGQSWVANANVQLSQQQYQIEQTSAQVRANTAGMADWVYPVAVQRDAVEAMNREQRRDISMYTNAQEQLVSEQDRLKDMQKDLLTVKDSGPSTTTLLMLPGRHMFNGFKVFICAPESVQPLVNVPTDQAAIPKTGN